MKVLSICIPTFKRSASLRFCINSIVEQIENYKLSRSVSIYVANDASPDDTVSMLRAYSELSYFEMTTREKNLGMNVNIKCMLSEAAIISDYQLIMTDDDYLQPGVLERIVAFLEQQKKENPRMPIIWTPRYSYSEDGRLQCVACSSFKSSSRIAPSAMNAGKYMADGFVLSGLIVRAKYVDFDFWNNYRDNAFFPMLFLGDLLFRMGAYYWDSNLVHHTCFNKCHWERWGSNKFEIEFRLFSDFMEAYKIMGERIKALHLRVFFYWAAFPIVFRSMVCQLQTPYMLCGDRSSMGEALRKLKAQGFLRFNLPLRSFMLLSWPAMVMNEILKLVICRSLIIISSDGLRKEHYSQRAATHLSAMKTAPFFLKLIL